MPISYPVIYDVIIAGAGPVGLFLACELRLGGCSVLVLEQARDAPSPLKSLPFGLRGLSIPTIESFDRRDMLSALKAAMSDQHVSAAAHRMDHARRPAGHFAGVQFFHDRIDPSQWPYRTSDPIGSFPTDMATLERILSSRAREMGIEILPGCRVEDVTHIDERVLVHTIGETYEARWLVGCDGGRSTVRKAAGFTFTGTEPEFTGYSVQLTVDDPTPLAPGRHYTAAGIYTYTAPGTIAMVDFDKGRFHRTEPTRDHIQTILRKVAGVEVTIATLKCATTWTDRAYQATCYRRGHVLLAGDAAHIHSPLGGQGLNLGLGDAINLGWKLAATVRGDAPHGLLDSYETERHPVAAQVLDWSRAQVTLMRPDRGSRALVPIIRDLMETSDGATYFAGRVWGVGLRYDLGCSHPLVGRSMPDFVVRGGGRANAHLRAGHALLLDFAPQTPLRGFADRWGKRLRHLSVEPDARMELTAALIRPDGVVAWASGLQPEGETLVQAARRWIGEPAT